MRTLRFVKYLILAVLADIRKIGEFIRSATGRIRNIQIPVIANINLKNKASLISIGSICVVIPLSITINWYSGEKESSPPDSGGKKVEEDPLPPCAKGCLELTMIDRSGKLATARFYYTINRSGNWRIGDTNKILHPNGDPVAFSIEDVPIQVMKRSQFIFTIGTASYNEKCPGNIGVEEDRAMARARKMASVIEEKIGSTPEVRTLSLGKYTKSPDMAEQRPAIVVAVISSEPGAKIPEAIMLALDNAFAQFSQQTGAAIISAKNYSLVMKGNIEFDKSGDIKAPTSSCY